MTTTELKPTATETESATTTAAAGDTASAIRPHVVRRQFVTDSKGQFKASLSTTLIVAGLLIMLNIALYQMSQISTGAIGDYAPELVPTLEKADRSRMAVTLTTSIVFLIGFAALRIVETHRTYGAAHNLERRMGEIVSGNFSARAKLRRDDRLQRLAGAFNEMAESLRERTRSELVDLQELAGLAERFTAHPAGEDLASRVNDLLAKKRKLLG